MARSGKVSGSKRDRRERRFVPQSTMNPMTVYIIGGVGTIILGAGVFGQFGNVVRKVDIEPLAAAPWILAAGAVILGVAIWLGTSAADALRVGAGGVTQERGQGRRIPWWAVEAVTGDASQVDVRGKTESGETTTISFEKRAVPGALAWVVKEARARIPDKVEIDEDDIGAIGSASKLVGEDKPAPPLQLVGKKCAKSQKTIAYEPDARVCPRCEIIYHRQHVPKTCVCGNNLSALREKAA
jgi:hypothetical protein